jgi:hypothetical protein
VGTEVQRPWIGALEAGVDVANDEAFIIAQVEEGRGVLLSSSAPYGGE